MASPTPFGKVLRKLRIDFDLFLYQMASKLNISPAYLSSIETGQRNIPDDILKKIADVFQLSQKEEERLRDAASRSQPKVTINLRNESQENRDLVLAFARNYSKLGEGDKEKITQVLGGE